MTSGQTTIHPTAIVEDGAIIGDGTTIGAFSVVGANASIGPNSRIDSHCLIGHAETSRGPRLEIGGGATIRSHAVLYAGSRLGPNLQTGHHVTIREGTIAGTNLRVGTNADVEGDCKIGDYVAVHSNTFVSQEAVLGDFVWLFPGVTLTNDPHPPSNHIVGVTIGDFAAIGAESLILPGLRIGRDSLVAAGAVVTADVPDGRVVAGVPARDRGPASSITAAGEIGQAYPWRRHFRRGYPDHVTATWDDDA